MGAKFSVGRPYKLYFVRMKTLGISYHITASAYLIPRDLLIVVNYLLMKRA